MTNAELLAKVSAIAITSFMAGVDEGLYHFSVTAYAQFLQRHTDSLIREAYVDHILNMGTPNGQT